MTQFCNFQFAIVPSDVLSASRGAFFSRSRLSAAAFAAAFLRRSMRQRRWRPISAWQKASEQIITWSSFAIVALAHRRFTAHDGLIPNAFEGPADLEVARLPSIVQAK